MSPLHAGHERQHIKHERTYKPERKLTKIPTCEYCGKEIAIPFRCPYCTRHYCAEHRLPENHSCPELGRARAPRPRPSPIATSPKPYKYTITYGPGGPTKRFQFSSTELKHLTIGVLLVMGVGLSYIYTLPDVGVRLLANPGVLVGLVVVFTLSFIVHEIAHKLSAQHYGLWAEFRLTLWGALLTLFSMLPFPFFKIISPGAVMIVGSITAKEAGKTALAGPLTNILISAICTMVLMVTQNTPYGDIPLFGAWINAIIAVFNLIPFGIMDGLKVFRWNKLIWTAAFLASLVLTVYVFGFVG